MKIKKIIVIFYLEKIFEMFYYVTLETKLVLELVLYEKGISSIIVK